jgi:hypothetical protein
MRTLPFLAALAAVAATAPLAVPAASARPTVRVIDLQPFTIRGQHFRPGERLIVTANVGRSYTRTIRASRAGSFTASFAAHADPCTAYNIRVLRSAGRTVTLAKRAPPGCAAPGPGPIQPDQPATPVGPAPPPAVSATPAISLIERQPLTLAGSHFLAGESVVVTAILRGGEESQRAEASPAGSFTVTFDGAIDPCSLEAEAVGAGGSRAALKLPDRMCLTE